jgi:hypothetical protein
VVDLKMCFDEKIEFQFWEMMKAQERMKLGRSLFFKDTQCDCGESLLCSVCSLEGRKKMTEIFEKNPICSYCRGIDVYIDFVEEYKEVLLATKGGIEDDIRWTKIVPSRLESRLRIVLSQTHYGLTLINLQKMKDEIQTKIDNYSELASIEICGCPSKVPKEILEKRKNRIDEIEKYLKQPSKALQETYFKLASVMNKNVSEKIITEANEKKIMCILENTQNFIYNTQSPAIIHRVFNSQESINIVLYSGSEFVPETSWQVKTHKLGFCFNIYW